jgi:hypothetical protein
VPPAGAPGRSGHARGVADPGIFTLDPDTGPSEDTVQVFFDMRRAAKDEACTEAPEPSVPPTVEALIADLAADPNLEVSQPSDVAVEGGAGQAIDIALAPGVTKTCPFAEGQPGVPLIVDQHAGEGAFWGVGPDERIRLVALQSERGHNIVVTIDSAGGSSFDALAAATMPIVESFVFEASDVGAPWESAAP